MELKIRDEYILLLIGIIGVAIGFIPIYRVNNICYVTLLSYCQGTTPVYIDIFEKLRLAYIPFFFASIVAITVSLPSIILRHTGRHTLHQDIKFLLTVALVFAQIPLLSFNFTMPSSTLAFSTVISDIVVSVDMKIEKLPTYYILSYKGVSPLLVLTIILLAYYLVGIIISTIQPEEDEN